MYTPPKIFEKNLYPPKKFSTHLCSLKNERPLKWAHIRYNLKELSFHDTCHEGGFRVKSAFIQGKWPIFGPENRRKGRKCEDWELLEG